jgi:hypothetical protein
MIAISRPHQYRLYGRIILNSGKKPLDNLHGASFYSAVNG